MLSSRLQHASLKLKSAKTKRIYTQQHSKRFMRSVFAFGFNDKGQLGSGRLGMVPNIIKVNFKEAQETNMVQVSCNWMSSFAVSDTGKLYAWGKNEFNHLGIPRKRTDEVMEPTQVFTISKPVKSVHAGRAHTLVLLESGELLAFGSKEFGQLGVGQTANEISSTPQLVGDFIGKKILKVAVGLDHSVVMTDEAVYTWGFGKDAQLANGSENDENRPYRAFSTQAGGHSVSSVYCGFDYTMVLDSKGKLWGVGNNDCGQIGTGESEELVFDPTCVGVAGVKFKDVACGGIHVMALTDAGEVFSWGNGKTGRLGHGNEDDELSPKRIEYFVERGIKIERIVAGGGQSFAIDESGIMYSWGHGECGRLGHGNSDDVWLPTPVEYFKTYRILDLCAGLDHTLVLAETKK